MRTWGFRFSLADALALLCLGGVAMGLHKVPNESWWLVTLAGGHFFLFCNVFRVRRNFELIWAALFVINVTAWLCVEKLEWTNVMACQFPITAAFVFADLRSPRYHGVFARAVNPRLTDYLDGRIL